VLILFFSILCKWANGILELNQLTGVAAILTFPLDVEVVEAEEREEEELRKKKVEEEATEGRLGGG